MHYINKITYCYFFYFFIILWENVGNISVLCVDYTHIPYKFSLYYIHCILLKYFLSWSSSFFLMINYILVSCHLLEFENIINVKFYKIYQI